MAGMPEAGGGRRKRGLTDAADVPAAKRSHLPPLPDAIKDPKTRQNFRKEITELYKCYSTLSTAANPSDGRSSFLKLLQAAEGATGYLHAAKQ